MSRGGQVWDSLCRTSCDGHWAVRAGLGTRDGRTQWKNCLLSDEAGPCTPRRLILCPAFSLAVPSAGSSPGKMGGTVFSGVGRKLTAPLGFSPPLASRGLCLSGWMSPGPQQALTSGVPLGVVCRQPESENRVSLGGKGCRTE